MQGQLAQGTVAVTTRRRGVLVADDEPEILDVLDFGLQREGFAVWLAGDGEQAVSLYHDHSGDIDAVLLDVRMPRLDGPRTLSALQEITPQVRCCFMSGYLGSYTADGLRLRGAQAILAKPFLLLEVVRVVRALTGADERATRATGMPASSPAAQRR
jgi:CheY-like chemotaxis protein